MSTPPTPPSGDAPLPAMPKPQMQSMQMGGAPAKSGKGKLIGIIAGALIIVGGLVLPASLTVRTCGPNTGVVAEM